MSQNEQNCALTKHDNITNYISISDTTYMVSALYMCSYSLGVVGWCDGLGLTSSAGASYNLGDSRARAYCACSRCGWGLCGHFWPGLGLQRPNAIVVIPKNQPLPK